MGLTTMPLDVMASRWEGDEDGAQVKDLERRISELEDRLYSQPMGGKAGGSFLSGDVYLNANGLNIISAGGIMVGSWQSDGDIFFGTDVNNPPSGVTIAIFNAAQTYNGESMGVGDMLFGDNSADKASMLWDASAGVLYFRGGDPRANQVYISTDGGLYAGGGATKLDSSGMTIYMSTASDDRTKLKLNYIDSGGEYSGSWLWGTWDDNVSGTYYQHLFVQLWAFADSSDPAPWTKADIVIEAFDYGDASKDAWVWLKSHDLYDDESVVEIAPRLSLPYIPTSSSGLGTGYVWRDASNYLRIV